MVFASLSMNTTLVQTPAETSVQVKLRLTFLPGGRRRAAPHVPDPGSTARILLARSAHVWGLQRRHVIELGLGSASLAVQCLWTSRFSVWDNYVMITHLRGGSRKSPRKGLLETRRPSILHPILPLLRRPLKSLPFLRNSSDFTHFIFSRPLFSFN